MLISEKSLISEELFGANLKISLKIFPEKSIQNKYVCKLFKELFLNQEEC